MVDFDVATPTLAVDRLEIESAGFAVDLRVVRQKVGDLLVSKVPVTLPNEVLALQ